MAVLINYLMLATSAVAALILYSIILVIYRLYFHPLAKFPGPKLAAATLWFVTLPSPSLLPPINKASRYEFYFDVNKCGSYIWKVKELHKEYGQSNPSQQADKQ